MKYALSARNQFEGTVLSVEEGAVNGIVRLDVNGSAISATISMSAIRDLDLKVGDKAVAVIKATEVMIGKGELRLSARNQFPGKVISVEEGAVNGIVKLKAMGDQVISASISMAAIRELELTEGAEATAVIKATSVMIGK